MSIATVIVLSQITADYKKTLSDAKEGNIRLVRTMSQQIELTLLGADNTLQRAIEQDYYNNLFGGNLPDYMVRNMQSWVDESPRIAAMVFVDKDGKPLFAANKKNFVNWIDYDKYSFAANPLFAKLQKPGEADYFIDKLPDSKLIIIAKKVNDIDGSFKGAFVLAMDTSFFIEYFRSIERGNGSYMSLQLTDSPMTLVDNPGEGFEYDIINGKVINDLKSKPGDNNIFFDSYKNKNASKIYSFYRLRKFPIALNIILDSRDYLKDWKFDSSRALIFLLIFIFFGTSLSYLTYLMSRQILRVRKSEHAAVLASQAKSEFLANMSHELRTPLNAIIGFSEMMNSGYFGVLNPKQKERVHDINLCGSHLLHLITDILEFSKGDAGKLELSEEELSMREIVEESIRMMHEKIKEKKMNLIFEASDKILPIYADKRKIRQVLLNLLSNAVKFTPDNGTIKISLKYDAANNLSVTVSDTGIGIAEKDIPTALSVFGQVDRTHSHEGTGLGLPLCKMFA
ncbi:MAG: histidine kinase dimerization/phospho-acceptor domain-containing protein, partial [Pseudomonadota bacterium]